MKSSQQEVCRYLNSFKDEQLRLLLCKGCPWILPESAKRQAFGRTLHFDLVLYSGFQNDGNTETDPMQQGWCFLAVTVASEK